MSVQNPLLGVGFGLSRRGRGGGIGEVEWKEREGREGYNEWYLKNTSS